MVDQLIDILNKIEQLKGELNALTGKCEPIPYLSPAQKAWVTRRNKQRSAENN
jgi:hypothetical protein